MSLCRYRVHGLLIDSAIPLPELATVEDDGPADITIDYAAIPANAGSAGLLAIDEVGRILVRDGRDILVDPLAGVDQRNVRVFLLGSALGLALHQRGLLPLHANAVVHEGKALVFAGPSGIGKSTLAAWCHDRGMPTLADDVSVVAVRNGAAVALPGLRRLRLWRDALLRSGRDPADFERSIDLPDDAYDKFDLRIDDLAADNPVRLGAIAILGEGASVTVERLTGIRAADALFTHTYRGQFVHDSGDPERHFQTCLELARAVPVMSVKRPRSIDAFDAIATDVLARLSAAV